MKKKVWLLALAVMCIASTSVWGQIEVFGGLGINYSGSSAKTTISGTTQTTDGDSNFGFRLAPGAGYYFRPNMAIGAGLLFQTDKRKDAKENATTTTSSFAIVPAYHLDYAQFGNFILNAEVQIPIAFGWGKVATTVDKTTVTVDSPNVFNFGINIVPGVRYKLSDHVFLTTQINIVNIGFDITKQSSKPADGVSISSTQTQFRFGGGLDNLLTIGSITVGAVYRF